MASRPPPPPPDLESLSDSSGVSHSRVIAPEGPAASNRNDVTTAVVAPEASLNSNSSSSSAASRNIPPVPKFLPEMSPKAPSDGVNPKAAAGGSNGQSTIAMSAPKPSSTEMIAPAQHSPPGARVLPLVPKFNVHDSSSPGSLNARPSVCGWRPMIPPPVPKFHSSGEKKPMGPPPPRPPRALSPQVSGEVPFRDEPQLSAVKENVTEAADVSLVSETLELAADVGSGRVSGWRPMIPPPVPKFHSSGEKEPMGPPPPRPPRAALSPQVSGELPFRDEPQLSAVKENGTEAADVRLVSETLELAADVGSGGVAVHVARTETVEVKHLAVDREGRTRDRLSAAAGGLGQVPYVKPPWSALPGQPYTLEIVKDGQIFGIDDVSKKAAYMFGRSDRCDFILEHPTVSRYHAVLQYNAKGESFLYDLGSTHGTFVNKIQVTGKQYVPLHVGDIVVFGHSTRLHAFQGPAELMPEEGPSRRKHSANRLVEAAQEKAMREESIIRGKRDALAANGITWGMQEDAEELEEEEEEEITWQTFKGELTDRQKKSLAKILKHNEKLSNLKKENDAIQAKETAQGGLTQGQQTQVGRNEMRMEQLVEEVENLEETLNESIRESISGRTGRRKGQKKTPLEDEDDDDLSDDEFYDRASKIQLQKKEATQILETADSLLDKKATLAKEMAALHEAVKSEEQSVYSSQDVEAERTAGERKDPLDQFMTNLSTTIVKDKVSGLQKELDSLTKESQRVERLLKIADPTGEGFMKWEARQKRAVGGHQDETSAGKVDSGLYTSKVDAEVLPTPSTTDHKYLGQQMVSQGSPSRATAERVASNTQDLPIPSVSGSKELGQEIVRQESPSGAKEETVANDGSVTLSPTDDAILPGLDPPRRLGAPMPKAAEEAMIELSDEVKKEAMNFVSYKDRKKANSGIQHEGRSVDTAQKNESPQTLVTKQEGSNFDTHVADSVALLLRHKRGLVAEEHNDSDASGKQTASSRSTKKRKKKGLAGTSQLTDDIDEVEEWVPPAGQTGDGRTALNEKYGY